MASMANQGGLTLRPIIPSSIKTVAVKSSRSDAEVLERSPSTRGRLADVTLPDGWNLNLCTSSNVSAPTVHSTLMEVADSLQSTAIVQELIRDHDEVGIVLDANQPGTLDGQSCGYYVVVNSEQRVLWLEDKPVPCTSKTCRAPNVNAHCVTAQYWKHCELFPTTFAITRDITSDLKDILIQAAGDRVTSKFSTSPYGKDDLEYMLNLVNEIDSAQFPAKEDNVRPAGDCKQRKGRLAWVIAKFMSLHDDGILKSAYGQSDDYFDIDYTDAGIGPYQRSWLMAFLAPFMLRSADVFAEELYSFHENFTPERWSSFVHKVDMSIRDSNLLATVLLSTSVSVLAISSVDEAGRDGSRSAIQIVIYLSIICSVGSIIIGLAIFKQYRAKGADTPLRAVAVLKRILRETYGLERLAIICSLPYVLLVWSFIAFLGAFAIVFYDRTDKQVRIPVSIVLGLVILALFSCLHTAGPPDKDIQQPTRESPKSRSRTSLAKWKLTKQDALPLAPSSRC
ncbi:hypothetical protein F5I97DRAFT_2033940 [Phlebopus sp. FC_14]|nr:hypothetical protein F5I97DRAFT_2033940 [Phlebopus sp. FC_14]